MPSTTITTRAPHGVCCVCAVWCVEWGSALLGGDTGCADKLRGAQMHQDTMPPVLQRILETWNMDMEMLRSCCRYEREKKHAFREGGGEETMLHVLFCGVEIVGGCVECRSRADYEQACCHRQRSVRVTSCRTGSIHFEGRDCSSLRASM